MRALFERHWGSPPGPIDEDIRRAIARTADPDSQDLELPALDELRAQAEGLASSEEELLLLGLFGEEAERLLRAIRGRATGEDNFESAFERARSERIREVVRIVQETGVGEVTIEEEGMRVSVRRTQEPDPAAAVAATPAPTSGALPEPALSNGAVRIESPMIGVFYEAPEPGAAPFVEVGEPVAAGQTLCLLEAMKLFNELKADTPGIVRAIHVENGQPVEFGQLLFELDPLVSAPLDAL